jgi:outer membrane protein
MRIFKASLIAVLLITVMLAVSSYAADAKIGIFNFDEVMSDSKMGKSAKAKLEKKHKGLKSVLERKKDELEKMDAKLEKDRMVMGKEKYAAKKYEIQKKAIDFRELERKSTDEMRKLRQELIAEINKEVVEIINQIGRKENYTIIVEKNISGAAYFNKQIDLTSRVVKALNSK